MANLIDNQSYNKKKDYFFIFFPYIFFYLQIISLFRKIRNTKNKQ